MKQSIENLIKYEIDNNVITKRDYRYVKNQLYYLLKIELTNQTIEPKPIKHPSVALDVILDCLEEKKILDGSIVARDLFDAKIMNIFAEKPSVIQDKFTALAKEDSEKATDFLYKYVTDLNYIRKDRVLKNISFSEPSKYGDLDITINLSKPEKDPASIALAAQTKSSKYTKCVLCAENEGFSGNFKRDSRDQHRLIEFNLLGEVWYFQYSPYTYYNEHAIVLSGEHKPMKITKTTFARLLELTDLFKGYFFGSNSDLPIVGGSILEHEHYQGGKHTFPIESATSFYEINEKEIQIKLLNWPLSTIRLKSSEKKLIVEYATKIYKYWKNYSNEGINIKAFSEKGNHHTVTPIARKHDNVYELDIILRDNQTSEEHPLGIFHAHQDKHHIKKENIGLIEAIGLAILPGRLKDELQAVKEYLLNDVPLSAEAKKHEDWANSFKENVKSNNVEQIIQKQLTIVFEKILEDCGVFKFDNVGIKSFKDFLKKAIKE